MQLLRQQQAVAPRLALATPHQRGAADMTTGQATSASLPRHITNPSPALLHANGAIGLLANDPIGSSPQTVLPPRRLSTPSARFTEINAAQGGNASIIAAPSGNATTTVVIFIICLLPT